MAKKTAALVILNGTAASRVARLLARRAEKVRMVNWRVRNVRRARFGWPRGLGSPNRCAVVLVEGAALRPESLTAIDGAVAALASQDLVLGPTEDGGFWLVGLARRRRTPPGLLAGVARAGDMVAAILARVPMRLWQVELLALEDCARLSRR